MTRARARRSHPVWHGGLAVLLGACAGGDPGASQPPSSPDTDLPEAITGRYLEAWPTAATALGAHQFDTRWPDLSAEGLRRDRDRIAADLALLGHQDPASADPDRRVDLQILGAVLREQAFEHRVERPWARDPHWYVQLLGGGLEDLTTRSFASIDERAMSVAARLEGLPAVLDQARNLLRPTDCLAPHTAVALEQIDGLLALVEHEIPTTMADATAPVLDRIAAATSPALASIRAFADHVRDRIVPVAGGQWRLGAAAFDEKLALVLGTGVDGTTLRDLASREHARVRARMDDVAGRLAARVLPDTPEDLPPGELVRLVLETLSVHHTQPPDLRDEVTSTLRRLSAFVTERDLVPTDPREVLEVVWTPPHQRGVFIAGLAAPGPLESAPGGLPSFYYVQPIPPGWDPALTESFLREYNDFMLEVLSIHEAIPGHFVQLYLGNDTPSIVRRAFQNGAFVEGWAVYAEMLMVEQGYAGAPTLPGTSEDRALAIELHQLKFYLRTITNALLDYGVHGQGMTRDEALHLMTAGAFQQQGEAHGKWIRAQLTSTQLSTYFAGAQAWLALRARARARAEAVGEAFDLKRFHAAALSHGAPPMSAMPLLLGWDET